MAYSVNGLVQAADYNTFADTGTPNLNDIWSVGTGDSGYGQPALSLVSPGNIISASNWSTLLNTIGTAASHQGTSLLAYLNGSPGPGNLQQFESNLSANLTTVNAARLNAIAQGSTSATTATSAITWSNALTTTFTVTFSSDNATRYFFNSGGQIGLQFSHPAGTGINNLINDLCSDAGTLWFSSPTSGTATLSGVAYNGVTKIGGQSTGGTTVYTNNGFYSVYPTGLNQPLLLQYSNVVYYSYGSTFLLVSASYSGAGVLTLTCLIDEVPNGATVSAGTVSTLTVRPPSTTYLTNTWGTPVVASSVSGS